EGGFVGGWFGGPEVGGSREDRGAVAGEGWRAFPGGGPVLAQGRAEWGGADLDLGSRRLAGELGGDRPGLGRLPHHDAEVFFEGGPGDPVGDAAEVVVGEVQVGDGGPAPPHPPGLATDVAYHLVLGRSGVVFLGHGGEEPVWEAGKGAANRRRAGSYP